LGKTPLSEIRDPAAQIARMAARQIKSGRQSGGLSFPAPTKETERAEATSEQRESGGKRCCGNFSGGSHYKRILISSYSLTSGIIPTESRTSKSGLD
jgi:uncharacterized membrane protein